MAVLVHGHVAIITETESTLRFDDVGVVPSLLPLLRVVQRSCMWSRKWSGRRPGNEARLWLQRANEAGRSLGAMLHSYIWELASATVGCNPEHTHDSNKLVNTQCNFIPKFHTRPVVVQLVHGCPNGISPQWLSSSPEFTWMTWLPYKAGYFPIFCTDILNVVSVGVVLDWGAMLSSAFACLLFNFGPHIRSFCPAYLLLLYLISNLHTTI